MSNGGSSSWIRPASRRTRCWSSDVIACCRRSGEAMPDSTDQLCAIESMRHSSLRLSRAACHRRTRRGDTRRRPRRAVPARRAAWLTSLSQRCANASSPCSRATSAKRLQHLAGEEAQPHAFAAAGLADPVHAVVPVAAADQRQAVHAARQAVLDRAHAMLVQASRAGPTVAAGRSRTPRRDAAGGPRCSRPAHPARRVGGGQHVAAGGQRQPQVVVGAARCARHDPAADATSAARRLRGTGARRTAAAALRASSGAACSVAIESCS